MRSLDETRIDKNWKAFLAYRDRRLQGVQTGIDAFDKYLLGLGGVTTIQGETGCNKSTLALQIVHFNLKLGHPCLMLDRENGDGRIRSRLMCQANNVSETEIKVCSIEQLKKYREPVKDLPLHVYTEATKDLELLKSRVEEALQVYQKPLILLVDSVQAMPPLDPDRAMNIEKWMNYFDQLKLDYEGKLTILITSEINRASYGLEGGLGAGKGSNAIEFKSETLIDLRSGQGPNDIKALIAKDRDGQKGAMFLVEKQFADPNNGASFTFKLDVSEGDIDV